MATKDDNTGSGLGLSMVYGIVKQSGGYTWIESSPGAGTAVHVLLPAIDGDVVPRGELRAPSPTAVPVVGGTILLVEDNPDVRVLFSTFLRQAGYRVLEAADGRDALDTFEASAAEIDLVVTDVVMPNVSGPALASALRVRRPDVKVLYVSGCADQLEIDAAPGPRATLLHKPVTRTTLVGQVAALMQPGGSASTRTHGARVV